MRAKDLVKDNIAYHSTLNQDVWDGDELRADVRYKLLEIAKRFIEYLDVPDFKLLDIILRGSLTNYNYTRYSDFDLHIVTDYATIGCDITEPFYMAKKKIWNDEHDIYIKRHEVELYVEDRDEQNASEGMYSVLDNKWHKRPEYKKPDINDHAIGTKAHDLMAQIDRAVSAGSVEDISRLQAKIKAMRQAGLDKAGEFSTENLAFKIIRNKGYIDRLYKTKQQKVDQELSLDERKKSKKKRSKRGYPVGGYYGYYWGGTNYNDSDTDAGGDAGGGGDGGGESVYEDDSWPKVDGGYEHSGLGYKRDPATGKYPVYPLPRWNIYSKYSRNEKGTSMDILHYMTFLQDSYQTASMDISGDEIANTIAKMYDKNPKQELQRLNSSQELDFNSWHDVYRVLKKHHQDEMTKALRPTRSLDEGEDTYSVKTDKGLEFKCTDKDHAVNKARSLLSYKKADKVYILQNGKAVYSWQLGSKLEPVSEGEGGLGQTAGIGINGKQFNFTIQDLIAKAKDYPIKKLDPQLFAKQLADRHEDPKQTAARAQSADLQYPIIVVQDGNTLMIADGTHRAQKAIMNKLPTINARVIPVKDMAEFSKQPVQESQARLDPRVEEFLDGLTPDDVGHDEVGDYVIHYEGFTDQCQDTEEYQNDPEAVFDQVWSDFRKRAGKDPINYGIVGEHDYPIVYSVFRK